MNFRLKNDYFSTKTYLGFLFAKLKNGDLWSALSSVFKNIRKYTLISAVIRGVTVTVSLLEKSAVLLLFTTSVLLLLPALLTLALICVSVCAVKYLIWHRTVSAWLKNAENVTVYLSSERIFGKKTPLFIRFAWEEAREYTHPVIAVCSDPFASVKWYSLNLLAVKPDYFFFLKTFFLQKKSVKTTYIVLS